MRPFQKKITVLFFPLLILGWGILMLLFFDPFFSKSIDPEYTYLVNGLNCSQLNFNRIGHTDNPGTTLQVYFGIIIQITHLVSGHGQIVQDVFSRPEHYLNAISLSMVFVQVLILIGIGFIGLKRGIPAWQLLILQGSSFYSDVLIWFFGRCNPDRFFVIVIFLFFLIYLKHGYQNRTQRKFAIFSGIVMALGFATKFNFLPMLILPLFLIKSNKDKLFYVGSGIVSFFIFVAPIIDKLHDYFTFLKGMFSHEGLYGSGESGILNLKTMIGNIGEIFRLNTELYLLILTLIVLLFVAFLKRKENGNRGFVWLFLGFLTFIAFQMLLVSKHFKNYYQAPLFATYAFIFFSISVFLSRFFKKKNMLVLFSSILPLLFILINGLKVNQEFSPIKKIIMHHEKVLDYVQKNVTNNDFWFIEPYWEGAPYKGNGIILGLSYCRHREDYLPQLMAVNPNVITYEENKDQVKLWRCTPVSLDSVVSTGKNIYVYSTPGRNTVVLTQMLKDAAVRNSIQLLIDTIYSDVETENKIIRAKGLSTSSTWQTFNVLVNNRQVKIQNFIASIKNSPEWLEKIKGKAIKRKIPLDSMILLDAIWMVDKKSK